MHGVITLCCLFPRLAFERSLELDPRCVGALVGLALLELNSKQVKNCTRKLQVMDLHTEGVGSGDETGKLHVTDLHTEGVGSGDETGKLHVTDLHTEGVGSGDETGKLHVTS